MWNTTDHNYFRNQINLHYAYPCNNQQLADIYNAAYLVNIEIGQINDEGVVWREIPISF